jgi:hypothetical protein
MTMLLDQQGYLIQDAAFNFFKWLIGNAIDYEGA